MKTSPGTLCALLVVVCAGLGTVIAVTRTGADAVRASQTPGVLNSTASQGSSVTGFDVAVHLTNQVLATQAELIVIGECISTETVWVDRNLYTIATISVDELLKGGSASHVRVALPGGVDMNRPFPVAMTYPGAPHISPQEEVFLFLTVADDQVPGSYAVMGFAQGKFSISPGDTGNPMVARGLSALQLPGDNRVVRGADRPVPLAAFKEEIRGYLQQP